VRELEGMALALERIAKGIREICQGRFQLSSFWSPFKAYRTYMESLFNAVEVCFKVNCNLKLCSRGIAMKLE